MSHDTRPEEEERTIRDRSRRTILKLTGTGAALAGVGGLGGIGAGQEADDGGSQGDDSHFVSDLIDPTFGYPLAADETDDLELAHVVELYTEEGEGDHEDFPRDPETGEAFPAEFVFDPVGVHVEPNDVVHFRNTAGQHTITAFHEKFTSPFQPTPTRVPEGIPGFTSPPLMDGESWVYQFPTSGVYDVHCLPHVFAGMVMRVVVFDPDEDDIDDDTFVAPTAGDLSPNTSAVFDADKLDPTNVVDSGTVAWEELTLEFPRTVQVREHPEHGEILVGPDEMTLYMFDQDTQGEGSSTCHGDCAEAWPPLTVDAAPDAGDGVDAELTTFERDDGSRQVAANGWPLYYFVQDEEPGDVTGQGVDGFGDTWWILQPDGTPIRSE